MLGVAKRAMTMSTMTTTFSDCLSRRDWLVEEMGFRYVSNRKIYKNGGVILTLHDITKPRSNRHFERMVYCLVVRQRKLQDKLDVVFRRREGKNHGNAKVRKGKTS